ncbi:urokinase plasminogen activator surface receptor [Cyanocitta cristata]
MEGTALPGVTGDPRDTLGHLNEVPGGATTATGPVTASPGSDKVLVATSGDVATEGTALSGVTAGPGATLGHLAEVPGGATLATLAAVTAGSAQALVATSGDVATERPARLPPRPRGATPSWWPPGGTSRCPRGVTSPLTSPAAPPPPRAAGPPPLPPPPPPSRSPPPLPHAAPPGVGEGPEPQGHGVGEGRGAAAAALWGLLGTAPSLRCPLCDVTGCRPVSCPSPHAVCRRTTLRTLRDGRELWREEGGCDVTGPPDVVITFRSHGELVTLREERWGGGGGGAAAPRPQRHRVTRRAPPAVPHLRQLRRLLRAPPGGAALPPPPRPLPGAEREGPGRRGGGAAPGLWLGRALPGPPRLRLRQRPPEDPPPSGLRCWGCDGRDPSGCDPQVVPCGAGLTHCGLAWTYGPSGEPWLVRGCATPAWCETPVGLGGLRGGSRGARGGSCGARGGSCGAALLPGGTSAMASPGTPPPAPPLPPPRRPSPSSSSPSSSSLPPKFNAPHILGGATPCPKGIVLCVGQGGVSAPPPAMGCESLGG